jgi:hypothetical protein
VLSKPASIAHNTRIGPVQGDPPNFLDGAAAIQRSQVHKARNTDRSGRTSSPRLFIGVTTFASALVKLSASDPKIPPLGANNLLVKSITCVMRLWTSASFLGLGTRRGRKAVWCSDDRPASLLTRRQPGGH